MAEGVGFEPTVDCPTLDFESHFLRKEQLPVSGRWLVPVGVCNDSYGPKKTLVFLKVAYFHRHFSPPASLRATRVDRFKRII